MSLDFNGTSSILRSASTPILDNIAPITIAFWASIDGLGEGSSGRFVSIGSSSQLLELSIRKLNQLRFDRTGGIANMTVNSTHNSVTTGGVWNHIAVTWTGGSNSSNVGFFVNGKSVSLGTSNVDIVGGANDISGMPVFVGNNVGVTRTTDGRMAHFHMFRRVLNVNEITFLMSHPAALNLGSVASVSTSGLIFYWPLQSTVKENDLSGNSHHSVAVTSVTFSPNNPPVDEQFVVGYPQLGSY